MLTLVAVAQDTTVTQRPFALSGFVEGYYSYDFIKPPDHQRPYFLYSHNRHNEFNVNLAYLKGSYNTERVRASLALATGTYMRANYAAEPGVYQHLYEASAGYKLSAAQNLWLDIGVLPSHIGFESAHSPSCWTLTRSLAAENSPYYEAGARLSYTKGPWLLSVLALNGWQRIQRVEGNSLVSWGSQVQYKTGEKLTLNYSTFLGADQPDSARRWRSFHDLYAVWQITKHWSTLLGFDFGEEQRAKDSPRTFRWYTPVAILRVTLSDQWTVALRGEYYRDRNGVLIAAGTPGGFKTAGFSANLDYRPLQNIAIRLEGRTLQSKEAIFMGDDGPQKNNTALTCSMAVTFE